MRNPSRRGAARISVVWMIVVVVLFLVAFGLAVVAFQDQSAAEERADRAEAAAAAEVERTTEQSDELTALTRAVGWFDPEAALPRTDQELLAAALEETRTTFGLGEDVKHFEDLLPEVRKSYLALQKEVNTLKQGLADLESEKAAVQQQMTSSLQAKDAEIGKLRRDLADAESAAADKQQELEGRIDDLRTRNNELDAEKRRSVADLEQKQSEFEAQAQALKVRMDTMARKLDFVEKGAEEPDGTVLEVSDSLGLAYIDLGANQRLSPGTRFRVVSPVGGRLKGWASVTRVEADMAEVAITDVVDPFLPVAPGDQVYNPLYDPRGERYAVLAGRFSGSFNEKELRGLLANMNIKVQDQVDILTDYLIVGSELYTDPETMEPLEEPMPPEELPIYKDVQARGGITILPLKDVRTYFKF